MSDYITPFISLIQGLYNLPNASYFLTILFSIVFSPFLVLFIFRFFFALFHR